MSLAETTTQEQTHNASPRSEVFRMMVGYCISQSIYAAAKLGLADLLAAGPVPVQQLAEASNTHPDALYRLLRALESLGLFREDEAGRFALTPLGVYLQDDRPDSLRPLTLMMGEEFYEAWGGIMHSLQTGKPAFDHVHGLPLFEYLKQNEETGALFDRWVTTVHGAEAEGVIVSYDFSSFPTIVDIGGGSGSLVTKILRAYPAVNAMIFDLPAVIERTKSVITTAGLDDRCRLIPGDFFKAVPEGGDLYLLRHIIHDWEDDPSVAILTNCRKAMAPNSKLLIIDCIIPFGNAGFASKISDVTMLIVTGGKERTRAQFESLLQRAGLTLTRVIPTQVPRLSIIEAQP